MSKRAVALSACIPAPYQIEFFDAIAAHPQIELRVIYSSWGSRNRHWECANRAHEAIALTDGPHSISAARQWIEEAEFFVCGWYTDADSRSLLHERLVSNRPLALWGERPRARYPILSSIRRRLILHRMRTSANSIWGIGQWAIDQWKLEFGSVRPYFNIPYFSDLSRFSQANIRHEAHVQARRFLFCGSLIKRKGVDLLARAFLRLAKQFTDVSITFVGIGELEQRLKASLKELGDRAAFCGFRQWDELPAMYHEHDVLVAPSRYDGWGMIVPEGLAAGLPVVSTTRTGAALDLINEQNGAIVEANSEDGLYKALVKLATLSAPDFSAMKQSAQRTAAAHSLTNGVQRFVHALGGTQDC